MSSKQKFFLTLGIFVFFLLLFAVVQELSNGSSHSPYITPPSDEVVVTQNPVVEPTAEKKEEKETKNENPPVKQEEMVKDYEISVGTQKIKVRISTNKDFYGVQLGTPGTNDAVLISWEPNHQRLKVAKGTAWVLKGEQFGSNVNSACTFLPNQGQAQLVLLIAHFKKLHLGIWGSADPKSAELLPNNTLGLLHLLYTFETSKWADLDLKQF